MATIYLFTCDKPAPWKAGEVGSARTPFYFSCADCGLKDAPIAGYYGSGPTFNELAMLGAIGNNARPAMFCAACTEARHPGALTEVSR